MKGTLHSNIFLTILIVIRYREIPTFGAGTIRRFASNASAMKKLGARDFEDLLQVEYFNIVCYAC